MINSTQNHLLNQMMALQAEAGGSALKAPERLEQQASFADLMQQAVDRVNETQMETSSLRQAFEMGENVDLAQVMIAAQKSRVSFEALTQVRNKLLSAYQDVMNMSV